MAHPLRRKFRLALWSGLKIVSPVLTALLGLMAGLGIVVARVEGWPWQDGIYFAFVSGLTIGYGDLVPKAPPARVLALDMSRVPDVEYSALQALLEGEQRVTASGVVVWLVGLNPGVLEMVRHAGLADRLGRERMLFNARAAIERYQEMQATAGPTSAT